MQTITPSYRLIDIDLLGHGSLNHMNLYYKTNLFGKTKFIKFATDNPEQIQKVKELAFSGDLTEELYIKEEDTFEYFQKATQTLREFISKDNISVKEKAKKIYKLSEQVMKDFFKNNAPNSFLNTASEAMELMSQSMQSDSLSFGGISEIINKDYYTYTHSVNVGLYCFIFGLKTKMISSDIQELGVGGMLHDVGKTKVSQKIVNKNGKLTDQEFGEIKKHTYLGGQILEGMNCYGKKIIQMATSHHEKYDGNGYPEGLVAEEIPYFARICKVMDVYDALTTRRSYKSAMPPQKALKLMKEQMSTEFDLQIIESFIRFLGE